MQGDLRNTNICYPKQETWFICWDDKRGKIKAYGSINTNQCMDTYCHEGRWECQPHNA